MPPAERRYGGASADERRAQRRDRLIRAAIAVYGERGYRQATVNEVCRAAELTPRYFYQAFANSDALLAAAFREVADFVMARVTEVADATGGTPDDRLREMLRAYYEMLRADPKNARVFLLEVSGITPEIDTLFEGSLERFAEAITGILAPHDRDAVSELRRTGAMYGLLRIARAWVMSDYAASTDEVVRAALPFCRLVGSD